jgi:hypothetical protein
MQVDGYATPVSNQNASTFWQVVSARSEREDAVTLGIGKAAAAAAAADGDSIDSRSH